MKGKLRAKMKGESSPTLASNGSPVLYPASEFQPKSLRSHYENCKRRGTGKEDLMSIMQLG